LLGTIAGALAYAAIGLWCLPAPIAAVLGLLVWSQQISPAFCPRELMPTARVRTISMCQGAGHGEHLPRRRLFFVSAARCMVASGSKHSITLRVLAASTISGADERIAGAVRNRRQRFEIAGVSELVDHENGVAASCRPHDGLAHRLMKKQGNLQGILQVLALPYQFR
jgi:hypothetical protein